MVKSFRFLLQFAWINLGALLVFALIVTVGSLLTGVPTGADNLFSTYFSAFPLMALMILYIYAFALCTSNLNLALSFGATRRGFFGALQGILLLYIFVSWLLQGVLAAIPTLLNWAYPERYPILRMCGFTSWFFPLLSLVILCLGCLAGIIFTKSKAAGVVTVTLSGVLGIGGMVALFITSSAVRDFGGDLFGSLPLWLTAAGVAIVGVSEGFLWHTIRNFMVK